MRLETLRDLGPLLSEYTSHRTLTLWHQNLVHFLPWEPICLETSSRARYFRSTILDLNQNISRRTIHMRIVHLNTLTLRIPLVLWKVLTYTQLVNVSVNS